MKLVKFIQYELLKVNINIYYYLNMPIKNVLIITLVLLIALITSSSSALALVGPGLNDPNPFSVNRNQDLINALLGITNAIKANTKAFKDAQTQQRISTLNQECVKQITAQIKEKATDLNQTDQSITDFIAKSSNLSGGDARAAATHLNYLYTLRGIYTDYYINLLIDYCSKYPISQVQQTTPTSGLQCNGKLWNACPAGQKFSCPNTGDPVCNCSGDLVFNKNNQCVTKTQVCKDNFGDNFTWKGEMNDKGGVSCECEQGFIWNPNGTNSCIAQTTSGTLCNGKSWSSCPTGQKFSCPSSGDPQCVKNEEPIAPISTTNNIPPTTAPAQTQDKWCKDRFGVHGTAKGLTDCSCDDGYHIPRDKNNYILEFACVSDATSTTTDNQVKNGGNNVAQLSHATDTLGKRIWSWFKGLFGF